jgi:hypothetical protein
VPPPEKVTLLMPLLPEEGVIGAHKTPVPVPPILLLLP